MSLSLNITQGNTGRRAGRKRTSGATGQIFPRELALLLEQQEPIYETAPGDASPFPGA